MVNDTTATSFGELTQTVSLLFFFFFPLRFTKDLAEMTEGTKVTNLIVRTADVCNTISDGMRLTRAANALKKKKRKRVRHLTERKFL